MNISIISCYGSDHFDIREICGLLSKKKLQQVKFLG